MWSLRFHYRLESVEPRRGNFPHSLLGFAQWRDMVAQVTGESPPILTGQRQGCRRRTPNVRLAVSSREKSPGLPDERYAEPVPLPKPKRCAPGLYPTELIYLHSQVHEYAFYHTLYPISLSPFTICILNLVFGATLWSTLLPYGVPRDLM